MKFFLVATPNGDQVEVDADDWQTDGGMLILKRDGVTVAAFVMWTHFITRKK